MNNKNEDIELLRKEREQQQQSFSKEKVAILTDLKNALKECNFDYASKLINEDIKLHWLFTNNISFDFIEDNSKTFEMIKFMAEHLEDINFIDNYGFTMLDYLIRYVEELGDSYKEIIQYTLKKGAKLGFTNSIFEMLSRQKGEKPIHILKMFMDNENQSS